MKCGSSVQQRHRQRRWQLGRSFGRATVPCWQQRRRLLGSKEIVEYRRRRRVAHGIWGINMELGKNMKNLDLFIGTTVENNKKHEEEIKKLKKELA